MTDNTNTISTVNRRTMRGEVVSAKMKNTVTVAVNRYTKHHKYKKYQLRTKKYLVHDPDDSVQVGQKVTIQETNPISKRKHFIIIDSN